MTVSLVEANIVLARNYLACAKGELEEVEHPDIDLLLATAQASISLNSDLTAFNETLTACITKVLDGKRAQALDLEDLCGQGRR